MGFYISFTTLGVNLIEIAVLAGALSVGIGVGLQSILNNFVSEILILFDKNFTPGDIIRLESGVMGIVTQINIRCTVIHTSDRKRMMVPNSEQFLFSDLTDKIEKFMKKQEITLEKIFCPTLIFS